ncbi:helix-hairpin-helix domain-containing protein [Carboxydochorda subterranea]|uniref:Helix-hairpin-helix domain-containing protein n=1 Tax=Carboxydichorda subterranea TaxID=3109565 RepID=A0ABZ1C1D3_9FIRM|nr:helix-hairpin-helix domain-containing protein [Limnochorda sp. L945t]WRP18911.1 helix-hairpin-helix domain-containing protein [Limnochorda sp. L945t]
MTPRRWLRLGLRVKRAGRVAAGRHLALVAAAAALFATGYRLGTDLGPPVVLRPVSVAASQAGQEESRAGEPSREGAVLAAEREPGESAPAATCHLPPGHPPVPGAVEAARGAPVTPTGARQAPGRGPGSPASRGGTVDINTASPEELDELPGIGPALAERIVRFRTEHGPFRSVDDLVEVPGIGPKTLERLAGRIVAGKP